MRVGELSSLSPMHAAAGGGTIGRVARFLTPRRTRAGLLMLTVAAVAVLLSLLASSPHGSAVGRAVTVALVIVQAASLAWVRSHPERSIVISLAAGVGVQALWPQLGVLGLANVSLCAFSVQRPPRVSLWALGFMLALAPWPAATRGALAASCSSHSHLMTIR